MIEGEYKGILTKLTSLCARGEHSSGEIVEKMRKWEVPEKVQAKIMDYLISNKFIDDNRYATAFVSDKIKYNKWGRRKIDQALMMKGVTEDIRKSALESIEREEYEEILIPLLQSKLRSTNAKNEYELRGKLMRFAFGRGFDMDTIVRCIDKICSTHC